MKLMEKLLKNYKELKALESNELLEVIYNQVGFILVIELLKFSLDYLIKPLLNWISGLFPEDWGYTK